MEGTRPKIPAEIKTSPIGGFESVETAESPPPPPPSFVRAPAEDRSKYEKLFCYGYSDAEEELEQSRGTAAGLMRLDGRSSVGRESEERTAGHGERISKNSARLKLTDEDSIGSATDLKNYCSDEDLDESSKRK